VSTRVDTLSSNWHSVNVQCRCEVHRCGDVGDCGSVLLFCAAFLATFLLSGRAEALLNVRPSVGMVDTMDRNIWDIIGEVKPSVNSGLRTSGVTEAADPKSLSSKKPA